MFRNVPESSEIFHVPSCFYLNFTLHWTSSRSGSFAQKDNRGVLGAGFRAEEFSEIVGYSNMADYTFSYENANRPFSLVHFVFPIQIM